MAALLWRLCHHHHAKVDAISLGDAARWAVVAGALACEKEGAIASLPRLEELEAMLQSVR
jgi:sugar/nucleoside kinase (ribokinase family)